MARTMWSGFGPGTRVTAAMEMQDAAARELANRVISKLTMSVVNGMSAPAPAPSSSSATITSASAAAPLVKTDSSSTISSTDPKAEATVNTISSPSVPSATDASTAASSKSSSSSGAPVSGQSSVGGSVALLPEPDRLNFGAATEQLVLIGDAKAKLQQLPSASVHMIVTSPPYYNLRDYKADGQLGQEATWQEYVARLVDVFREARRVLRDDGTLWLVMGDSYVGSRAGPQGQTSIKAGDPEDYSRERTRYQKRRADGLKDKDLIGVPWRLAFALQDDGWYLRCDMPWVKPNPMPESVRDRPTRAHEYVFLLSKSPRYYYDRHAIMEESQSGPADRKKMLEARDRINAKHLESDADDAINAANSRSNIGRKRSVGNGATRNARSVWTIATEPFRGKHFAAYPKKLVEKCILAGTSEEVCSICSAPHVRVVANEPVSGRGSGQAERKLRGDAGGITGTARAHMGTGVPWTPSMVVTTTWEPSCRCGDSWPALERGRRRAVVLDPFAGAMTTAIMAERHGRDFVGIELNREYVVIGVARVEAERLKWTKALAKQVRANRRKSA